MSGVVLSKPLLSLLRIEKPRRHIFEEVTGLAGRSSSPYVECYGSNALLMALRWPFVPPLFNLKIRVKRVKPKYVVIIK